MNNENQNEKHNLKKKKNLHFKELRILLLNFRLAGLRELGKNVFFCGVPKVPSFGTVKVLMNAFLKSRTVITVSCIELVSFLTPNVKIRNINVKHYH